MIVNGRVLDYALLLPILLIHTLALLPTTIVDIPKWTDSKVASEGYNAATGVSNRGNEPATGPEDPSIYESRVACTSGDFNIFDECKIVIPECALGADSPDGEPGTVIYWYSALKAAATPVWAFHSGPVCVYGEKPRDILAEIAGQIAHEFQQTAIAAADVGSQPGPHTLRGKETNVWAEASTQTFNVTLLGQAVTITATPVAYTWDYGDGTVWGPSPIHGAPLHEDRIGEQTQTSHAYIETGEKYINLTTHFNGTYTVNGGPELPIPGRGNIPSPQLWIKVWRAETHLYADNCFQNPQGIGC